MASGGPSLLGRGIRSARARSRRRWRRASRRTRRRARVVSWWVSDAISSLVALTPVARARARSGPPAPPACLLSIYRRDNRDAVGRLVEEARSAGWRTALWALDEPVPELREATAGSGPGPRTELLNRLASWVDPRADEYVVIADDDIAVTRGGLDELLRMASRARLGLAQPAHDWKSFSSHDITVGHPWSAVRHTGFVEIGPVLVISPEWRDRVLPLPTEYGMGWGLDFVWQDLEQHGCRLGIVDTVRVRHLHPPGDTYDDDAERARLDQMLAEHGLTSVVPEGGHLEAWRLWQPEPPWIHAPPPSGPA
jgi:hypothetical protein